MTTTTSGNGFTGAYETTTAARKAQAAERAAKRGANHKAKELRLEAMRAMAAMLPYGSKILDPVTPELDALIARGEDAWGWDVSWDRADRGGEGVWLVIYDSASLDEHGDERTVAVLELDGYVPTLDLESRAPTDIERAAARAALAKLGL